MRTNPSKYLIMFVLIFAAFIMFWSSDVAGQKNNIRIQTAFNPAKANWDISWPGRISQYDLVCLSPPVDPMQGIPLGNGDVGVLFWCDGSKIIAVINKSDL